MTRMWLGVAPSELCDQHLLGEYQSEHICGENHPSYLRVEVECQICGKVVERKRDKARGRNFCSVECYHEWNAEHLKGMDYVEGPPPKRGWFKESMKKKVRNRDNCECQHCGMAQEEHQEVRGTKLHVHHIIPITNFDNPNDAHYEGNLVTLCWKCHRQWEKIPGLRPQTAD